MATGADSKPTAARSSATTRANLRPVVWSQVISLFGDYVAYVTLPLFIVQLTGSAFDLGLTMASETLPMLLFGLAAGVILDRANLKRALIFSDVTRAVAFSLLALAVAADVATPVTVFATAFVVGSMSAIFNSGLQTLMPLALSEDLLIIANSRLQLARTLAWTTGAAAGGAIIEFAGAAPAFLLNAATFLLSAVLLATIRDLAGRKTAETAGFRTELVEGLKFLWSEQRLRWATIGAGVLNLIFAPLEITLALFGRTQLGLTEAGVGWLFAGQALIGAVGAAVAPRVTSALGLGRTFVAGNLLMGIGFLAVTQAHSFIAVIPVGVALIGVSWMNVAVATMRQRLTPQPILGRVTSASITIAWAGIPAGAAAGGFLGDHLGLVDLYTGASSLLVIMALVLTATALWRNPVPDVETATPD